MHLVNAQDMLIEQKNLFEMQSVFLLISKPQLFVISEVRGIQNPFHHLQQSYISHANGVYSCIKPSWLNMKKYIMFIHNEHYI